METKRFGIQEKKIITAQEILKSGLSIREIIKENRDWLLGGENHKWQYFRDLTNGDLVLLRH